MNFIHDKLGSKSLKERITWGVILFFSIFFICVIISYYFLPEGILKGKNPLHNWNTSNNIVICAFQIFSFNMISAIIIVAAGLFGQKKTYHKNYLSIGYFAFYGLICINAVVLGTWSFLVESVPVPLLERFFRTFDIVHRAGLWEMLGQLTIACATAKISIILTNGKETVINHISSIRLSKKEQWVAVFGVVLMVIGAIVESLAINTVV